MGRPYKEPNALKTDVVKVCFTKEKKKDLREIAKILRPDISFNQFLREMIDKGIKAESKQDDIYLKENRQAAK